MSEASKVVSKYKKASYGRFIENFSKAAEKLKIEDDELLRNAAEALAELSRHADKTLRFDKTVLPSFAGHGMEHVIQLSFFFVSFISQNGTTNEAININELDCLLLLFSAFLFHDIGMTYDINTACETCEKYSDIGSCKYRKNLPKDFDIAPAWKDHLYRNMHDCKSLIYIEKELIEKSDSLSKWRHYWDRPEWTDQADRLAFLLVARICESHGEIGLPDLDNPITYERKCLGYDGYEDDGYKDILTEGWEDQRKISDHLMTASSVLCLLDLCDIGPDRMELPESPGILEKSIPDDEKEKLETFFHWVSHHVGKLEIKRGKILYKIPRLSSESGIRILSRFFTDHGASRDLFLWGNKKRLSDAIRTYTNLEFHGIHLEFLGVKKAVWDEVDEMFLKLKIHESDTLYAINDELLNRKSKFLKHVVLRNWFEWLYRETEKLSPIGNFERFKEIRKTGLVLEKCFNSKDTADGENNAYVVALSDHTEAEYYLIDSFLAANNLVLGLIDKKKLDIRETELIATCKGLEVHAYVKDGVFGSIQKKKNTIILVFVGDELRLYDDMIQKIKDAGIYLVLICEQGNIETLEKYGAKRITFGIIKNKIELLKAHSLAISKACFGKPPHDRIDNKSTDEVNTPASVVHNIFRCSDVSGTLADSLMSDIKSNSMDLLFFVTLFELICYDGKRVDEAKFRLVYEDIAQFLDGVKIEREFTKAVKHARHRIPSLIRSTKKYLYLFQDKEEHFTKMGKVLLELRKDSEVPALVQYAILPYMQSMDIVYNANSELFKKYLPIIPVPAFGRFILDKDNAISDRLILAFGLAETLVSKDDSSSECINTFIGKIIDGSDDLKSEKETIVFQTIYRIARRFVEEKQNLERFEGDFFNSPLFNLGLLEALSSGSPIQRNKDSFKVGCLGELVEFFTKEENYERFYRSCIMAYDILSHYEKRNTYLSTSRREFDRQDRFQLWGEVCTAVGKTAVHETIRRRTPRQTVDKGKNGERSELFKDWKDIKHDFYYIINRTPVWIKPRESAVGGVRHN